MTTKYTVCTTKKHKKKTTSDHFYRIDSGRYKGVEYVYGDVRVQTHKDAAATITFDFDVLYSPLKKVKAEAFTEVLKEILDIELLKLAAETPDEILADDTPSLHIGEHDEEFHATEILP
jgi:hypothetical protein